MVSHDDASTGRCTTGQPFTPAPKELTMARLKSHGRMKTPVLVIVAAGLLIVMAGLFSCLNRATADNQDARRGKESICRGRRSPVPPPLPELPPLGGCASDPGRLAAPPVQRQAGTRGQGSRGDELHALPPGRQSARRASRCCQLAHAAGEHAHGLPGPHARGACAAS